MKLLNVNRPVNMPATDHVLEASRNVLASGAKFEPQIRREVRGTSSKRAAFATAKREWAPALLLLFLDILVWVGIYGLTIIARGDAFYESPFQFFVFNFLQLAVILAALVAIGGYNRNIDMRSLSYTAEHILAVIAALLFGALVIYSAAAFNRAIRPSRGVLLASFVAFLPISIFYRRLVSRSIWKMAARNAFLVVGAGELAAQFYDTYLKSPNRQRLEFVDLDRQRIGQHIAGPGSPVIEGDLATKLRNLTERYSGVILAEQVDKLSPHLLEQLVRTQFLQSRVYTLESFYEAHWRFVPMHSIDPFWPLQTGFQLAQMSPYHYIKRVGDIFLSSVLLLLAAPFFGVIAIAIWMINGKPAIFRQTRVSRDNKPFTLFKFRTMLARTEEDAGDIYTRSDDPRVTRLGWYLRKLRLDELPQLWNVLKGEMSLIGPRAEWIRCAERYEKIIPFYHFRHLVKPGITGWAQVNYPYGESENDAMEKLKYDLYYIRHYSLKLDAMIVLKTIYTVLFGKGR